MQIMLSSDNAPADLVALFKATQHDHAALKTAHETLERALEDKERDLADSTSALKQHEGASTRSAALVASLRQTVDQYVRAAVLHEEADVSPAATAAFATAERQEAERHAATAAEIERRLETQLAAREAEAKALRTALAEAEARAQRATDLERERDAERAAACRESARALEQEALVREHVKRAAAARETMGRSEMDHQRRIDGLQEQLNTLSKRLRSERSLKEGAQARVQELTFQVAAGTGAGAGALPLAPAHTGSAAALRPPPAMFRSQPTAHGGGGGGVFGPGARGRGRVGALSGSGSTTAAMF